MAKERPRYRVIKEIESVFKKSYTKNLSLALLEVVKKINGLDSTNNTLK
jgi:hypothetical protein